jgi:hypothetical protein
MSRDFLEIAFGEGGEFDGHGEKLQCVCVDRGRVRTIRIR